MFLSMKKVFVFGDGETICLIRGFLSSCPSSNLLSPYIVEWWRGYVAERVVIMWRVISYEGSDGDNDPL